MFQVYINSEEAINKWLQENKDLEIIDFKFSYDPGNERYEPEATIMVVYKI